MEAGRYEGLPETLLERCAEKIERQAHPKDRADLLAVTQVLTGLRFPNPDLLQLLGGKEPMIESPVLQKMLAEAVQKSILGFLKARFGTVPQSVAKPLRAIVDEKKLTALTTVAAQCPNLEAFREELLS